MQVEHQYQWWVQYNGKWMATRYHCTQQDIMRTHPEARRIEGTLIEQEVQESLDAAIARIRSTPKPQQPPAFKVPPDFMPSFSDDVPF
ncbi:MAG: hypothetical protein RSD57_17010 [Comamonas sp.]